MSRFPSFSWSCPFFGLLRNQRGPLLVGQPIAPSDGRANQRPRLEDVGLLDARREADRRAPWALGRAWRGKRSLSWVSFWGVSRGF